MSIQSRIATYSAIEKLRGRPLIVYVTSPRANACGQMGADVVPEVCDQISALPAGCKKVDLLVVSSGGDAMVAWRIISMLREVVGEISVLVPYTAYSAATLLTLGADDIIMHPFANLGPIDPQIETHRKGKDGQMENVRFGAEDMEGFLNFARKNVGLSNQVNMLEVFKLFCAEAGPIPIGIATRSSQLSMQLGIKLLQTRSSKRKDSRKAKEIVDRLNKQYFNHGYALGRQEAREIGLKVQYPTLPLENAMWSLWQEIEMDVKARIPFDPMCILASNPITAGIFSPLPSLSIPSNTPPQIAQQILQKALANPIVASPAIDYAIPYALLESTRVQKMFLEKGKLAACRGPNGPVFSQTKMSGGWDVSIDCAT